MSERTFSPSRARSLVFLMRFLARSSVRAPKIHRNASLSPLHPIRQRREAVD